MSEKRVLIVLTSVSEMGEAGEATGFWLSELTHPYYAMADRGIDVDIVSIGGGRAPVDPRSMDMTDGDNRRFMENPELSAVLEGTRKLSEADPSLYRGIVFAGGHGTMWDFPEGEGVQEAALEIYERGGVVAAICHGPAALINLRDAEGRHLIEGKRIAAFTNAEEEAVGLTGVVPFSLEDRLRGCRCEYVEGKEWSVNIQSDQRIVTGQNPQSAMGVGEEVARILKG